MDAKQLGDVLIELSSESKKITNTKELQSLPNVIYLSPSSVKLKLCPLYSFCCNSLYTLCLCS